MDVVNPSGIGPVIASGPCGTIRPGVPSPHCNTHSITSGGSRKNKRRSKKKGGLRLGRKTGRWIAERMGVKYKKSKKRRTRARRRQKKAE